MRNHRKFTFIVSLMVVVSFLYSNIVWALPNPNRETLAPQSELVQQIARLDIKASLLLSEVFGRLLSNRDRVGLELLLEWIKASENLHETLTVQKEGGKILILARGFNVEFAIAPLEGGNKLPNSDIWVRINYYSYEPFSSLTREQETYIHRCQRALGYLLNNKFVKIYGHEPVTEIKYLDLAKVVGFGDEDKDRLVSELSAYLNSGNGRVLILLGNYFDMKGLYNALARQVKDEVKLRNIFALGRFTYVGDTEDPKKFIPPRNMLCYTPSYSEAMLMPLYQFVYRRTLEHRYKDGKEVVKVPIVIEEFSPFFERDARRIEDLEIRSWKGVDVVVRRENIRERHYRNPVYIIREGGEILGGIATSCMQIGGEYKKNIPPKYKDLIASHNPSGDTIFDFSVFTDVNPEVRKKRYGDILALSTLEIAKLTGKREVIAASRCEGLSMLTIKAGQIDFKRALSELANILARIRTEKGVGEDYRFVIDEVLPYILSRYPGQVLEGFDIERFIQEHLSGDPFLNAFHHRLGSVDVLVVPNSRRGDIRGLGAQVYTSYYDKLHGITADPRDREGLARQIFGRYYDPLTRASHASPPGGEGVKPKSKYPYDFSIFKRERNLRDLSQRAEPLDILIIGGGIVGAGIARDASLRGLKVGLVDKGDFASGTSSRSSRLVHGGLRYLGFIPSYLRLAITERSFGKYLRLIWHDSIRLVFEASRERRTLLRIAPHLVRPLRFLIPVYKRGLLKVFIGTWLYDLLSLFRNTRIHRTLFSARAVTNLEGSVNREGLKGGSLYYDAGTNDSRLVLENILSANEKGALIANYTEVSAITYDGNGRVNGAIVEDKLTGQKYTIKARKVINAAGPWIDSVRKLDRLAVGEINDLRLIGGSHIIVPRISDNAVVIFADDKRVIFVIPLDDNRSLVGTTEREFDSEREDLDNPQPTEEEINYLLANVNRIFPNARLTKDRIIQATAGVRPLTESIEGIVDPNLVSRSHGVHESSRGLISVGGVKLTTYRSAADSVVTRILREIRPLDRTETSTDKIPLYGGEGVKSSPQEIAKEYEIDRQTAEYLVNKYGSKYTKVLGLTRNHPELKERIIPHLPYIVAEILYAVHFEMTVHLVDFVMRRTDIDLQDRITMDNIWLIARLLGAELGWSEEQIRREVKDYVKHSWRMRQKVRASFKGYIKRDIPGWAEGDPSEIRPEPSRMVDIGIDTAREKINLDIGDFIYAYFPDIDTSEVMRMLHMCFNTRLELFNQDNILWERLKQRRITKITLHSILESKTLFGNHSGDGIAWVNIPAIRYLVSSVGDRQIASELLGILLGIGLSHEILGHEAGISSDGVLTFQDAMLTLEMLKAIKYNLPEYMNLLREILTEDSPYIKQLKAIMTFTDLVSPPIVWGGPEGIISDMGLVLKEPVDGKGGYTIFCYNRESEGEIEEIGGFSVRWAGGIPYIQFNFKKAYSHLILSSGNVMGSIITSITERLELDINRIQILIEKPTVELIPVRNGEESVLVPVSPLGSVTEEPIDLVIRQGTGEHTVGGLGTRQFYHWRTANFTLSMMENEVLPIGHMDGFFSSVFSILEKILNGRGPASAILQEIDTIVFVVYDLGEETEFIFKQEDRADGNKRLVIAINKDSNAIIDPGRLMYAFLRFFISGQKRVDIPFKEVDSRPAEEKGPRPDYTIVRLNDNIKLELGSNGEIGRVWADGREVSSFLVERSIPRLRSILASLPRNISLPAELVYDVEMAYRGINRQAYYSFKSKLNRLYFVVLEHIGLDKKILNYSSHNWDGLEAIFNFSDSIPWIDAFRHWLIDLDLDSIIFDLDEKVEQVQIDLRGKVLVVRIPIGLKDTVNQIYLITCMLCWFYQNVINKRDIEFDDIHQAISQEISGRKEARAQFMTIDIGSGLKVYIDKKGWIGVKYGKLDIPLILVEALIPGFRQYILGLPKVRSNVRGPASDIHCGMIGKGISPDEVADSELIPVSEEELEIAIVSLELRLRLDKRSGKTEHADKIEKIINAIKLLAERKRIFKFSAKVRGTKEFLLGFADKRGIALCNEFFEGGSKLNTVLDEALFHEAYHLWAIQKRIDPGFAHDAARRLQEIFFKDYIHYKPGPGEPAKRSNLRGYARELINKKSRRATIIGIVPPAASPGDRHGPDRKETIVWDKTPEEQIVLDESGEEGLFFIKTNYKAISDKTEILGCVKVLTTDRVTHLIFYLLPQYAEALTEDIVFKKIIGAFINSYGISPAHLGIHTNYYKKGVESITISWRGKEYQVTVKRLREDWEGHLSGKLPGMQKERVVQTPPPMPEVVTTIQIQPDSPAHNKFSIIPEYSEAVEDIPLIRTPSGIIDKPYNMVRLNLSGAIVDLVVPSEYADQAIALRLCRSLAVAVDAILNLPDIGGINILKERIVENLSEIRLEIDRSRLDVSMERSPYSVGGSALVFNLPFLDISDMDANAFFFSLLYFFTDKNRALLNFKEQLLWNPPLNESDVDPGFYRLYWWAKGVMADRKKAPGEWIKVRIPPPHDRSFMRWWDVFIHKTGVVKVKLGDKDIPLFLLEKQNPGFRRSILRSILSLPEVSGWIKGAKMFQASIREGVPGWSREDTDSLGVKVDIWDEGIIKEYFPMVDAKMVIEIVQRAFSKRMALVTRGDLGTFSFHFVRESNSLFGNHKRDGLAWANLGAIQYMIEKIEDEGVKTIALGIILGVGLSHEILGHEAGIDDDELLTEQDELLTRNLAGEYNLNLADYLKFLGYIITEESPYYEQLESYLLTLIVGDIYYKLSKRGDLAVLNNLGLLGALTGAGGIFKFSDRFSSWGGAYVYFNNRKKEFLKLLVSYYIMFADDISSGAAMISDRDLVRALADKFKACFKLELGREEDRFLVNYMERMWLNRDRKAEGAAPENLLSKEEIEERIIQRFKTDKAPGLLYFDLDKILEEDSGTASGYMDLLERIAGIKNYAVVIVNSNPERSIGQILREVKNPRLTGIIRQNITIDAHREKTNNGEDLLDRAIGEAGKRLGVDSIPEENITMAIYISNRWKYPEELLRRFSVIIMTASLSKIDEEHLKRLERYFPDIGRLVRENRELLLREELREMNKELESQHQADMGIRTQA